MEQKVKYLLDSNILLEIILDQQNRENCEELIATVPLSHFAISEFTLNSILLHLIRDQKFEAAKSFIRDFFELGDLNLFGLVPSDFQALEEVFQKFGLDYDDSYQYLTCQKYNLSIVTYDSDFNSVDIQVFTPEDLLGSPPGIQVPK